MFGEGEVSVLAYVATLADVGDGLVGNAQDRHLRSLGQADNCVGNILRRRLGSVMVGCSPLNKAIALVEAFTQRLGQRVCLLLAPALAHTTFMSFFFVLHKILPRISYRWTFDDTYRSVTSRSRGGAKMLPVSGFSMREVMLCRPSGGVSGGSSKAGGSEHEARA